MTQKLLDRSEQDSAIPPDPPPSAEEKLNESLTLLEKLQNFTKGSPTADPLAMMSAVIEAAKVLNQSNSPQALTPFMDRIASLEEKLRATESEMLRGQLTDIRDQLRALKEAPPPSNVLLPDGSNLDAVVRKAVEKAVDDGLGADNTWWVEPLKALIPVAMPPLMFGLQRLFTPTPPPQVPMPPPNYQAGATVQQQPQLPPVPQQAPQAQPQASGAYTTGNPQLDALLMMIQVPLADMLRDGDSGKDFAEFFIPEYGLDIHTQLASGGVEPIVSILYAYPPLTAILKPLARERVVKFITEFVNFKPEAVETPEGGAA
jgi:hypothetical protein